MNEKLKNLLSGEKLRGFSKKVFTDNIKILKAMKVLKVSATI
jgi:hypothetical protein